MLKNWLPKSSQKMAMAAEMAVLGRSFQFKHPNQDIDFPIFSHIFLILEVISTGPFLRDDRGSNRVSLGRWRLARQGSVHAVITLTAVPWTSKLVFIS
jgi:hypothetical protein